MNKKSILVLLIATSSLSFSIKPAATAVANIASKQISEAVLNYTSAACMAISTVAITAFAAFMAKTISNEFADRKAQQEKWDAQAKATKEKYAELDALRHAVDVEKAHAALHETLEAFDAGDYKTASEVQSTSSYSYY